MVAPIPCTPLGVSGMVDHNMGGGEGKSGYGRFVVGLVVGLTCATLVPVARGRGLTAYPQLAVLSRAFAEIEANWVKAPDPERLVLGALRGMVRTLDPHSDFMDPEAYSVLNSDAQGRFGGIGVEIEAFSKGKLRVLSVFPESPAAQKGVRPGDEFLEVAGQVVRDMTLGEVIRVMRGPTGTTVEAVIRNRAGQVRTVRFVREVIHVRAVESRVLGKGLLYVRVRAFQVTTTQELRDSIDVAEQIYRSSGGVTGVMLDLRGNPGGLVEQAVLVSDEFLDAGVIVTTRGRGGVVIAQERANSAGTRPPWPMVVLVDRTTASAAEILSAALQDSGRAVVVGERTFGKGTVQSIVELPGGSALKLTIARYYSPAGQSIQALGVRPDVVLREVKRDDGEVELRGHLRAEAASAESAPMSSLGRQVRRWYESKSRLRGSEPGSRGDSVFADDGDAAEALRVLRYVVGR